MPPGHPIWRLLRAQRLEQRRWEALRRARLAGGRAVAAAEERAYLGALLIVPSMIRIMAVTRPPAWFTDAGCLAIMQALYCLRHRLRLRAADVADVLLRHGALWLAGGPRSIEELVAWTPLLARALEELEDARRALLPVDREPLIQLARHLLDPAPAPDPQPTGRRFHRPTMRHGRSP